MGRHALDLTGRKFGALKVIRRAGAEDNAAGHAQWLCECDCGALHVARGTALTSGNVLRCKRCSKLNLDPAVIGRETVVDIWYHAAGAESFAIAKDPEGKVIAHTNWSKVQHKVQGHPAALKQALWMMNKLADAGVVRPQHPKEGTRRWAMQTNVTFRAHLFTPLAKMVELWAQLPAAASGWNASPLT